MAGHACAAEMLGDVSDGSRTPQIHLIPLLAEPLPGKEPDQIYPDDDPLLPFSTRQTCGACHSYQTISTGWHFNAVDANVSPGRNGQPWILADASIATQIPLSYRPWPGTFGPEQVGLTPEKFVRLFGRHLPGGGIGEMLADSDDPEEVLRADVTGLLEINCLACHNTSPGQDMGSASGYSVQVIRGNYRWAATASCEFAYVTGSTNGLSAYDFRAPYMSAASARPPVVEYNRDVFGHNDWVRFDVSTEIPQQRCYFCHSNVDVRDGKTEKWIADEDVHLAAGLKCVDCHSHGLDHNITRGYLSEPSDSNNPLAASSSCEGCHLGADAPSPVAGRFAAPVPSHPGIPPVHFDKLSCTACHSGPWPSAETVRTKTARAHALGIAGAYKYGDVLPHLFYPVFAVGQDGKIGIFKIFWPAYWAQMTGDTITPLDLDTVRAAMARIITGDDLSETGDWPNLNEEDIAKVLSKLASEVDRGARPVYVSAGRVYSLEDTGQLVSAENEIAAPYMWPIAHDVRPAAQSLGVRQCEDCHSADSPFFFGLVAVDSPLKPAATAAKVMVEFELLPRFYTKAFALSFVFRPWLKVIALLSSLVICAVLVLYGLKALAFVTRVLVGKDVDKPQSMLIEARQGVIGAIRKVVFLLALLCFVALAVTGFVPIYVLGEAIQGWWLMTHIIAGGIFTACIVVLAVLWADNNRLDKNYWPWLNVILHRQPKSATGPQKHELKLKVCFWLVLILSLPVILSAVLGMFTLFGTHGQVLLLQIHRYCALLLSLFAIVYLCLAALTVR